MAQVNPLSHAPEQILQNPLQSFLIGIHSIFCCPGASEPVLEKQWGTE
jgi:hypothetical protein